MDVGSAVVVREYDQLGERNERQQFASNYVGFAGEEPHDYQIRRDQRKLLLDFRSGVQSGNHIYGKVVRQQCQKNITDNRWYCYEGRTEDGHGGSLRLTRRLL